MKSIKDIDSKFRIGSSKNVNFGMEAKIDIESSIEKIIEFWRRESENNYKHNGFNASFWLRPCYKIRPITEKIPKVWLDRWKTFSEYQIKLKKYEIKDIILCIGYSHRLKSTLETVKILE